MSKTKFKQTMRQIMIDWTNDYMNCSPRLRKLNSMLQETVEEKWEPIDGHYFHFVNSLGFVDYTTFTSENLVCKWCIQTGNCFPYTKEGKKMTEETTSVRITQRDIYEKLIEVQAIQIELVAEIKNLKDLPNRMNRVEQKLARFEWIEKLAFSALGAGLSGFVAALWALIR